MENNKDKPYSLQDAKTRLNKKLFCSMYNKIEELRKENEHVLGQALEQRRKVLVLESEIERLKESNKELVEALRIMYDSCNCPLTVDFADKVKLLINPK